MKGAGEELQNHHNTGGNIGAEMLVQKCNPGAILEQWLLFLSICLDLFPGAFPAEGEDCTAPLLVPHPVGSGMSHQEPYEDS